MGQVVIRLALILFCKCQTICHFADEKLFPFLLVGMILDYMSSLTLVYYSMSVVLNEDRTMRESVWPFYDRKVMSVANYVCRWVLSFFGFDVHVL